MLLCVVFLIYFYILFQQAIVMYIKKAAKLKMYIFFYFNSTEQEFFFSKKHFCVKLLKFRFQSFKNMFNNVAFVFDNLIIKNGCLCVIAGGEPYSLVPAWPIDKWVFPL